MWLARGPEADLNVLSQGGEKLQEPFDKKTPSAPQAAHTPAPRITVVGIPNFAKVSPKLYRGGQPHGAAYAKLKQMGVDIVVDVRLSGKEREKKAVTDAGMRFVALPWHCM